MIESNPDIMMGKPVIPNLPLTDSQSAVDIFPICR